MAFLYLTRLAFKVAPYLRREAGNFLGQFLLNREDRSDGFRGPGERRGHEAVTGKNELDSALLPILQRQFADRLGPEVRRELGRNGVVRVDLVRPGQRLVGRQVEFRLEHGRGFRQRRSGVAVGEVEHVLVVDKRLLQEVAVPGIRGTLKCGCFQVFNKESSKRSIATL